MIRYALAILAVTVLPMGAVAQAKPAELKNRVSSAQPAGCVDYRFLFTNLYRAELWSDSRSLPGPQYGLSLTYRTDFSRESLVDTSIEEMARISGRSESSFATARRQLQAAFRSVNEGDRITAWRESAKRVRFYRNGSATASLTNNVDLFMSIWLGSETRFPRNRDRLLSGRCSA